MVLPGISLFLCPLSGQWKFRLYFFRILSMVSYPFQLLWAQSRSELPRSSLMMAEQDPPPSGRCGTSSVMFNLSSCLLHY